jgi:hypothetical protein
VAQFRYLETTITNQNLIQEEIKRRLNWSNACYHSVQRNACRILVGKSEGKRPLGRPRCRWVNNIKMDLRETGWDGMDWIGLD